MNMKKTTTPIIIMQIMEIKNIPEEHDDLRCTFQGFQVKFLINTDLCD